jgi:hypothetical protein
MKVLHEYRKLLRISVEPLGENLFHFRVTNVDGYKNLNLRTKNLAKFLRKIHAKDTATSPASMRNWTYIKIAEGIINGTDREIWVWQYQWDSWSQKIIDY